MFVVPTHHVYYQPNPSKAVLRIGDHHVLVEVRCGNVSDHEIEIIVRHMTLAGEAFFPRKEDAADHPYTAARLRKVFVDDRNTNYHFTVDVLHEETGPFPRSTDNLVEKLEILNSCPDGIGTTSEVRLISVRRLADDFSTNHHRFYDEWLHVNTAWS